LSIIHYPLDIVIINYNSTDHLLRCLESVYKDLNGIHANIFILDNASSDTPGRLVTEFPEIIFTQNDENLGFSRAVNQALKQGIAEYVILLNPDTRITVGFFASCLSFMQENSDVGVMGPKILDPDAKIQHSARAFPNLFTAFFGRSSLLSKWFPRNPLTARNLLSLKSDGTSPISVDWVSGACMAVRRKTIDDAGLLDERFFMYWEDADWCRRIGNAGWKVMYFPKACVYHHVGVSSETRAFRSAAEFHKSVYRFFDKYTRFPFSLLKPLVFGGLMIRFGFVLLKNYWRQKVFGNLI
jgi:GT2 family glycosyltransferase